MKLCWNFFGSFYGKGPLGGFGDTIKRIVTQIVIQRKLLIYNGYCIILEMRAKLMFILSQLIKLEECLKTQSLVIL